MVKKTKKLYPKVLPFYIRLRFKLRAKNRILAETTKKKTYFQTEPMKNDLFTSLGSNAILRVKLRNENPGY